MENHCSVVSDVGFASVSAYGKSEIQRGLEALIEQHHQYKLNKQLLRKAFKEVFKEAPKPKGKKKRK